MKKTVVDHLWNKIGDLDMYGSAAAQAKLDEVVELARKIHEAEGSDVASNVLAHGLIETALLRCRQLQDYELPGMGYDELQIFHGYATNAMKRAEKVIDTELAHLGL